MKIIYDYFYTKWVYYLINNNLCKYQWFYINDFQFIHPFYNKEKDIFELDENNKPNPFIKQTLLVDDKKLLGYDVLDRGNFFPFFSHPTDCNNIKQIRLGAHRIHSLNLIKDEIPKEKVFLNIDVEKKYLNTKECLFNYNNSSLPCYLLTPDNNIYSFENIVKDNHIWFYFMKFSDQLAPKLFDYKNIQPQLIWNDKNAFENFISKPFNIIPEFEDFSLIIGDLYGNK